MIAEAKNTALIPEYARIVDSETLRHALCLIVGLSASLYNYNCHPEIKGVIRDYRFYASSGEQEFSFIPNRKWLLFYFRLPAVRSGRYSIEELSAKFNFVNENTKGEWTVRLHDGDEVVRLWAYLSLT